MANSLDITWPLLLEPGMDDLAEGATDVLKKMVDDLKIYPFQDKDGKDRLFLGRYSFPKFGEKSQFPDALDVFGDDKADDPAGFIDALTGFPIDCVELMVIIGEYSSKAKEGEASKVNVQAGTGVTPPVPPKGDKGFFKWPEKDKILLNLTAIATKGVAKILAPNLEGEPKPKNIHWWLRIQLTEKDTDGVAKKWPILGEFIGLGVRLFPGSFWGHQLSSPFVYSGCWFDSIYLTGGSIKTVNEPTDTVVYPTYVVTWRGRDFENVRPSDFSLYKTGDRCSILKDVSTTKTEQTWKDDDAKIDCDKSTWMIVPISYYGGI